VRSPLYLVILLAACAPPEPEPRPHERLRAEEPYGRPFVPDGRAPFAATGFNAFIMKAATDFGAASYLWQGDGVTRTITYQGSVIAKPYAAGKCHCVGGSFQVYLSAFEAWDQQYGGSSGSLRGLTVDQVKELKQVWYVATSATEGSQAALAKLGLGSAVSGTSAAQQGDPAQL